MLGHWCPARGAVILFNQAAANRNREIMNLEWTPLLQPQRDLYRIPRGMDRFRQYLRVMLKDDGSDLRLPPLVAMNPMAKEHVAALLDALLALDAESIAADALAEASARLADVPGDYQIGL